MSDLSNLTTDELLQRLKSMRNVQLIVSLIFAVILAAWVILGYWKTNTPVFIITMVMAFLMIVITNARSQKLKAVLAERNQD